MRFRRCNIIKEDLCRIEAAEQKHEVNNNEREREWLALQPVDDIAGDIAGGFSAVHRRSRGTGAAPCKGQRQGTAQGPLIMAVSSAVWIPPSRTAPARSETCHRPC